MPRLLVSEVLFDKTILLTGSTGLVGENILHRLLTTNIRPKRVYALIRGSASRIPQILTVKENLTVLSGDLVLPSFGLPAERLDQLSRAVDILIHCAAATSWTLPLADAFRYNAEVAYQLARFSYFSSSVKAHVSVSSCYVNVFRPATTVGPERLLDFRDALMGLPHENTYFHSKAMAEHAVNLFASDSVVSSKRNTNWLIARLSAVGPAVSFPSRAWGHHKHGCAISAVLRAKGIPTGGIDPDSHIDAVPVDIAANQVLSAVATTYTGHLKRAVYGHDFPADVPVVQVASGPQRGIRFGDLWDPTLRCIKVDIPEKVLEKVYGNISRSDYSFATDNISKVVALTDWEGALTDIDAALVQIGGWRGYLKNMQIEMDKALVQRAAAKATDGKVCSEARL